METKHLFSLDHTIAKELLSPKKYPWEVLSLIKDFIMEYGKTLDNKLYNKIGEDIWIAKSAKVSKTAEINGPLIIGENTEIRHCAFIRGSAIIGDNCVIGNSCEIKNSIIFDNVQVPHFNYVGDSILGYKSHLGAGAVTSNVKSDKTPVSILCNGEKINTNLKKNGAMVGDYVEVGCNSVLCPGTVIGKNSTIYPLSMVRGYIKENSIFKNAENIVEKQEM